MQHKIGLLLLLLLLLVAYEVGAWGPTGHQIVADVAELHMSRRARHLLRPLLELLDEADALFPHFFPSGYTHTREGEKLALSDIAVAVDVYRRQTDNQLEPQRVQGGFMTPFEASSALHFINIPRGREEMDLEKSCRRVMYNLCQSRHPHLSAPFDTWPCCRQCLTSGIDFYKTMLQEPSSREQAAIALMFVVHLVGDIHQPLHSGYEDDRGGNEVPVSVSGDALSCTNLHQVWDAVLVERRMDDMQETSEEMAERLYMEALEGKTMLAEAETEYNVRKWVMENMEVLQHEQEKVVLNTVDGEAHRSWSTTEVRSASPLFFSKHTGDIYWKLKSGGLATCPTGLAPTLSQDYQDWATPFMEKRLAQAGIRLGALLTEIFDGEVFWRLPWVSSDLPKQRKHRHTTLQAASAVKKHHDEL